MENYEKIADELIAENHVSHGPGEPVIGRAEWKKRQKSFLTAFANAEFTLDAVLADGEEGAIHYTFSGTHIGELENLAPTGKEVSFQGVTFFRMADGWIAESWALPDRLALLEQLGLRLAD